ncbi:MAG: hypothetical protein WBD01_14525 [Salaquimonas sp.]
MGCSLIPAFVTTMAALLVPLAASADHGKNFHCDFNSFVHPKAASNLKAIAGNNRSLLDLAEAHTLLWEDAEIKRICTRAASGSKEDFGCLGGRQDFEVIKASIPPEFFKLSQKELRPHYLALQQTRADERPRDKALNFCGDLGVVDRSFK